MVILTDEPLGTLSNLSVGQLHPVFPYVAGKRSSGFLTFHRRLAPRQQANAHCARREVGFLPD